MKGQTQAVTAVMITGIMIGTIAAVYIWGTPLLEKRESQAALGQVESDAVSLMNSIDSVSRSGDGSGSQENIRITEGEVEIDEEDNYIEITTFASASTYPLGSWTVLEGDNLQGLSIGTGDYGIAGQDSRGIVAARADESGADDRIRYRVEFRNMLDDPQDDPEAALVDLQSVGSPSSSGETTIDLTNRGTETDTGQDGLEIQTGETIDLERTVVEVDFQ